MPVLVDNRQARIRLDHRSLVEAARRALAGVGRPAGSVEVSVVDDRAIRRLNGAYRGVARRTDVLAFPLETPGLAGSLVGQIAISAETAARQARQFGVPRTLEMALLVTHGVLHLVGYDDRDPVEAALMHRRERGLLASGRRPIPARLWSGLLGPEIASRQGHASRRPPRAEGVGAGGDSPQRPARGATPEGRRAAARPARRRVPGARDVPRRRS
jgi:probable rRNA maturation factor